MIDKPFLFVSFSGGRTSAYMAKMLIDLYSDKYVLVFVFMNTGLEHKKTLEFVDKCDKAFGMGLIWIEAVVHHGERKGSGFKVVNFETAARAGEPFEEVIEKYGIPNASFSHCNRELKLNPFKALKKALGIRDAFTAIGIRIDEIDRMSIHAERDKLLYPLISWFPTTKPAILAWWKKQPFDLEIPEHLGNCGPCWKKSKRKLLTIAKNHPESFWFTAYAEAKYPNNGAGPDGRVFFRKYESTLDILKESEQPFDEFVDGNHDYDIDLDAANGCSESCDIFADD